jgi:hypothetical protein
MPKIRDNAVTFLFNGDDLTGEEFIERIQNVEDPAHLRRIITTLTLGMEATRAGYNLPGACIDLEGLRPRAPKVPPLESDLGKDGDGKLIEGVESCFCGLIQGSHGVSCGATCTRNKESLNVVSDAKD